MWRALLLFFCIAGSSYCTSQYTSSRETYVEQRADPEQANHEAQESQTFNHGDSNVAESRNLELRDDDSSPAQFIRVQDEQNPEIVEVSSDGSGPNEIDVGVSGSAQINMNGVQVVDDSYASQSYASHVSSYEQADEAPVFLQTANGNPGDAGEVAEALPQPEHLIQPRVLHPLQYLPQTLQPAELLRPAQQQQQEQRSVQFEQNSNPDRELRIIDAGQPAPLIQQQDNNPETVASDSGELHIVNGNQDTIRALHDTLVNRVLAKQQEAIQQQTIAQVLTTANVQQQQVQPVAKSVHSRSKSKPVLKSGRGAYPATSGVAQPQRVLTSPVNSVMATRDLQIVRAGLGYQQQPVHQQYTSVSPSAAPISADQLTQLQNAGYELVRFQPPQSKVLVQQSILTPKTYSEQPGSPLQTVVQTLAGPTTTELMSQIGYTAVQDTPRYTVYKVKDNSDQEQNAMSTARVQYVGQQEQAYQQQQAQQSYQQQLQQSYQQSQQAYQQPQQSYQQHQPEPVPNQQEEYQEIQALQRSREQQQLQRNREQLQRNQEQYQQRQDQEQLKQQHQRKLLQEQRDIEQQQRDLQLRLHHKQQVQLKLRQQQQNAHSKIDFKPPQEQSGQTTFSMPFAHSPVKQGVVYKSSVDPDYYNAVKAKLMHTFAQMNYLHQAYPYFNPYASPFGPRPDLPLQYNPYTRGSLFGQPQLPFRPDFNPYYPPDLLAGRPAPFRAPFPHPPSQPVPAEPLHTAGSKIIPEFPPLLKAAAAGNKLSPFLPTKHALESPLFSSKTVDVKYAPGVDLRFDEAAYAAEQARRLGGPAFIDPGHIQPSIGFKLNENTAKFEQLPPTKEIYKYQHKEFLEIGAKIPSPPPPPPPSPPADPVSQPQPTVRAQVHSESDHSHPQPQQPQFNNAPYLNNLRNNAPHFGAYSPLNININGSPYPSESQHQQQLLNPGRVEVNAIAPEQKPALPHHLLAQLLRATTGEVLELEQY